MPEFSPDRDDDETLHEDITMRIYTRYFVQGSTQDMVATELRVDYGIDWKEEREDYLYTMPAVYRDAYNKTPHSKAMTHGYDFGEMYSEEDGHSMEDVVIESVLFDQNDNFAGFTMMDIVSGLKIVDSPI